MRVRNMGTLPGDDFVSRCVEGDIETLASSPTAPFRSWHLLPRSWCPAGNNKQLGVRFGPTR